jgi:aminopeptidase
MTDIRIHNFASILIDYSTRVKQGDQVGILTGTEAVDVVRALYPLILERGGHPYLLFEFPGQEEIFFAHANDDQLDFLPRFHKIAFEEFDVLLKIRAEANTRSLSSIEPARQQRRSTALSPLLKAQMRRGAVGELRWMSTIFPTQAYAIEADMGFEAYQDFFYRACHADPATNDPVSYWMSIKAQQQRYIDRLHGHDWLHLRGPNVDLRISIKDRIFINASGENNLPDGEIFTGPVENTAEGWVRYTYPAMYGGRIVEGVELTFKEGRVVQASAAKNQDFLLQMIDTDAGARYIGEFAIGTNYEIDRFTRSILFDEKIGGSFHMALGASYPETGGRNQSNIHWDMICDLRESSEIIADGEQIYQDGKFID